ncbi:MAG: hypothetical protein CMJ18_08845 [Phycisphaeraceae bacterium]|nr:hypothetical protein [Phycisphaeraceae bacterium]
MSQPGTFSSQFRQTCQVSHGEAFFLSIGQDDEKRARPALKDLQDLKGRISIHDLDGEMIQSLEMDPEDRGGGDDGRSLQLAFFYPFENGNYQVTIDVDHGVAALAGTQQTIQAKYLLCGAELFPAKATQFFAWISGVTGMTLCVFIVNRLTSDLPREAA